MRAGGDRSDPALPNVDVRKRIISALEHFWRSNVNSALALTSNRDSIKYESNLMLNGETVSREIHSLSDFKRNTHEFIEQLKQTGEPVVLTINGRAKIVVQDADSYQRMLELLDRAETIEAIREGLDAVKLGNTISLDQFDKEMRRKIRTPKKK